MEKNIRSFWVGFYGFYRSWNYTWNYMELCFFFLFFFHSELNSLTGDDWRLGVQLLWIVRYPLGIRWHFWPWRYPTVGGQQISNPPNKWQGQTKTGGKPQRIKACETHSTWFYFIGICCIILSIPENHLGKMMMCLSFMAHNLVGWHISFSSCI